MPDGMAPPRDTADRQPQHATVGVDAPVVLYRYVLDALVILAAGTAAALLLDAESAVLASAWAAAVVVIVRSDLERFIIPDGAAGIIAVLGLTQQISTAWREGESLIDAAWRSVAAGGLAFALFWAIAILYRRHRGSDGLGFGDVKLAGASAIWLTAGQQVAALEIACLTVFAMLLVGRREARLRDMAVPFGAFLAPAAWLVFVTGPATEAWFDLSS